jgi:hypothetical protein
MTRPKTPSTKKAPRKRTPAKKKKNLGGRPRVQIDWDQFSKLCAMQCTLVEIAGWFNCSVDTIERACKSEQKRGFAELFGQKRGAGFVAIRRSQFQAATGGNPAMLIWLGKQWLGQRDRQDVVTITQVEQFSDAYIEAGRSLVESLAAGATPEEVLRMFVDEVQSIAGGSGSLNAGPVPN